VLPACIRSAHLLLQVTEEQLDVIKYGVKTKISLFPE
jgi:hypothetical protein